MYVNLKLHSDYELLVATSKIEDYLEKASKINMPSISISNSKLYNAINNYTLSKNYGIKYIFSLEVDGFNLYAKNIEGYKNLLYLSSLEKIKYDDFSEKNYNLVVITGSFNSLIYEKIINNEYDVAVSKILEYKKIFSDFYLELPSFIAKTNIIYDYIRLIKDCNVDYVITNDVYYLNEDEEYLQDILLAIKENKKISNINKKYPSKLYFKTFDELKDDFKNIDSDIFLNGINNTIEISKKCNVDISFDKLKLPIYNKILDDKEELRKKTYNALEKLGKTKDKEYLERLNYELEIIDKMKFNSYFLITQDIVKYARENDILVGVGRGSAAGSLVSYLLEITKIDPIKYKLIFERFLNTQRQGMPDIDIDIEALKREKLINYIFSKYGVEYVSNIVSFATLKEKQLIKDLERVLGKKSNYEELKKISNKLLNNARHTSIHASGVVISSEKLINDVPISYDKMTNTNVSQYDMKELEKIGLLKMDFLGLSNLDIISDCLKQVNISLDSIELDNKKAFEMYNLGHTVGIFQVEAYGVTELMKKMKINSIEDISLVIALYRPGPLGSGMVDKLILRKNENEKIKYEIEDLGEILDESYGVIIYQEQVMKIATKIAGFSLVEADLLRKAISKKKSDLLKNMKDKFITRAIERNYEKQKVVKLYELIENFAEYGFNKAHSISYAITSYYTAYLKANYTKEYMVSLLNNKITDFSKLNIYYNEILKFNIFMLEPNVNKSSVFFKVENDKIRYALYSIVGISKSFATDIVKEREKNGQFLDINDFCFRMIKYGLNEKNLKVLAESGAFSDFNITRSEIIENIVEIFEIAKKKNDEILNVTKKLFYTGETKELVYIPKNIKEYTKEKINELEIKNLGLLLSYTNTDKYRLIYSLFDKIDKYKLAFVYNKDKLFVNGIEYENKKINLSLFKNKLCVVQLEKNKITSVYSLKDILFRKSTTLHICIDYLTDFQKEYLKEIIRNNGGFNRVYFYKDKKKLDSNTYIDFNLDIIITIIKNIGIENIRIKI